MLYAWGVSEFYDIYDPSYPTHWLLAKPLRLETASVNAIYRDRWSVGQIPLAAKQMVWAYRQFVHNAESIQRLPGLALLIGKILGFLSATQPAEPTGHWDYHPKSHLARLQKGLFGVNFCRLTVFLWVLVRVLYDWK